MNEERALGSRRSGAAFGAALAATVVTAIAAIGGLQHWQGRGPAPNTTNAPVGHVVTPSTIAEEDD